MSNEKLIDRIKKLYALAGSANEHEASLAMERAADLMREHGISKEAVSDSPFAGDPTFEAVWQLTREAFNGPLVYAIAKAFGGSTVGMPGEGKYDVLGTPAIIVTIKGMYEFSLLTIDRLTHHEMQAPDLPPFASGAEKTKYKNRYRAGLASGMMETLNAITRQNAQAQRDKSQYGLVLVTNSQKVQVALKQKYPRLTNSSSRGLGGHGFGNGKATGRGVGFSKQTGNGSGQKMIG